MFNDYCGNIELSVYLPCQCHKFYWQKTSFTLMSAVELNPSSWFSSSSIVRWTSLSPAFSESNRLVPIASNSSMKIIAGAFSLARAKASLTNLAPSPINICTNCGPANFKNVDFVWAAQARANRVFPEKSLRNTLIIDNSKI